MLKENLNLFLSLTVIFDKLKVFYVKNVEFNYISASCP